MSEEIFQRWEKLMQIALGKFKIEPRIFWQMTPQELIQIIKFHNYVEFSEFSREDLEELRIIFPDRKNN